MKARPSKRYIKDEKERHVKIRPRRGVRAATVTATIGDGEGGGEGRAVRRESVVNRTSEGERTLRMSSVGSIATVVAANMVVSVVTVSRAKDEMKRKDRKG